MNQYLYWFFDFRFTRCVIARNEAIYDNVLDCFGRCPRNDGVRCVIASDSEAIYDGALDCFAALRNDGVRFAHSR